MQGKQAFICGAYRVVELRSPGDIGEHTKEVLQLAGREGAITVLQARGKKTAPERQLSLATGRQAHHAYSIPKSPLLLRQVQLQSDQGAVPLPLASWHVLGRVA